MEKIVKLNFSEQPIDVCLVQGHLNDDNTQVITDDINKDEYVIYAVDDSQSAYWVEGFDEERKDVYGRSFSGEAVGIIVNGDIDIFDNPIVTNVVRDSLTFARTVGAGVNDEHELFTAQELRDGKFEISTDKLLTGVRSMEAIKSFEFTDHDDTNVVKLSFDQDPIDVVLIQGHLDRDNIVIDDTDNDQYVIYAIEGVRVERGKDEKGLDDIINLKGKAIGKVLNDGIDLFDESVDAIVVCDRLTYEQASGKSFEFKEGNHDLNDTIDDLGADTNDLAL